MNLNMDVKDIATALGDEDKKKVIALGALFVVVIAVLVYLFFFRSSSSPTQVAQTPPATPTGAPGPGAGPGPGGPRMPGGPNGAGGAGGGANAPASTPGGGGSVSAVSFASLGPSRSDPFTPEYILPPPPPPPPVPLPTPETLPQPQSIPPAYVGGLVPGGNRPATVLTNLPRINIPRFTRIQHAPKHFKAPKQVQSNQPISSSSNKRLSGVIIGDSVHALLEVTDLTGTHTYVVQPGDTVAGIRVLSIERVQEGGTTVPRMLIREKGVEHYVDLKASLNPSTDQQQGGGMGGPGGAPGNPSILPAPSINPVPQIGRGANPFTGN